jgi:hypothetical protein
VADSPDETLALARTAAGAVRSLNHATLGGAGLAQPAAALASGQLGCDDGTDPVAAVSGAWMFMSDARSAAAALARDLGNAQQQLAAVHGGMSEEAQDAGEGAF